MEYTSLGHFLSPEETYWLRCVYVVNYAVILKPWLNITFEQILWAFTFMNNNTSSWQSWFQMALQLYSGIATVHFVIVLRWLAFWVITPEASGMNALSYSTNYRQWLALLQTCRLLSGLRHTTRVHSQCTACRSRCRPLAVFSLSHCSKTNGPSCH
jgi:hypothetical protein